MKKTFDFNIGDIQIKEAFKISGIKVSASVEFSADEMGTMFKFMTQLPEFLGRISAMGREEMMAWAETFNKVNDINDEADRRRVEAEKAADAEVAHDSKDHPVVDVEVLDDAGNVKFEQVEDK